jgi:hypothetical protein
LIYVAGAISRSSAQKLPHNLNEFPRIFQRDVMI